MNNTALLLVMTCSLACSIHGMDWTIIPAEETLEQKKERDTRSLAALLDVWQNGMKSHSFNVAKQKESKHLPCMPIHDAVQSKNLAQCILHVAHGTPLSQLSKTNATLLHRAAQSGFLPFCQFLLTISTERAIDFKQQKNHSSTLCLTDFLRADNKRLTPLHHAVLKGHHNVAALLLKYNGVDTTEKVLYTLNTLSMHIGFASILSIYKHLELKDPQHLLYDLASYAHSPEIYQWLPLLFSLGAQPTQPDHHGRSIVHALVQDHMVFHKMDQCLNLLPAYQLFLERKALLTLLMIHRFRKDCILAQIPKDVIRFKIAPLLCPLSLQKDLSRAVDDQLGLLVRLLAIKDREGKLPYQLLKKNDARPEIVAHFEPDKLEAHREALIEITKSLMRCKKSVRA